MLFQQVWPTPETLFDALYQAGAGTVFVETLAALEALDAPDLFRDDHLITLEIARESVGGNAQIGEAVLA